VKTENMEIVCCPLCGSDEGDPLFEWRTRRMVRCRRCNLLYRNPRPTASDVRGAYAGERTSVEWEERVGDRRNYQFRRFLNSFPDRPGRLLDIGCGYGFFLKMAEERGWEAVGVDLDPKGIAYAKERLRVNAILGDLKDVQFPDGSFDLVTLWNVVECVPDPLELLRHLRRVLKEGGTVFIRTQNETWQRLSFRLTSHLPRFGGEHDWEALLRDFCLSPNQLLPLYAAPPYRARRLCSHEHRKQQADTRRSVPWARVRRGGTAHVDQADRSRSRTKRLSSLRRPLAHWALP